MPPFMIQHRPPMDLREKTFERAVLATEASVGLLRDLTEVHLLKWGLSTMVEDTLLISSELLTNAVRATPGELLGFKLLKWPTVIVIEVHDTSKGDAATRPLDQVALTGRGLHIVDALSRHWGQHRQIDGSKIVFALIEIL